MKDGGPAFPCYIPGHTDKHGVGGLSLRDYFAAQALQGMIAKGNNAGGQWDTQYIHQVAEVSYDYADAMLAQRWKGKEE